MEDWPHLTTIRKTNILFTLFLWICIECFFSYPAGSSLSSSGTVKFRFSNKSFYKSKIKNIHLTVSVSLVIFLEWSCRCIYQTIRGEDLQWSCARAVIVWNDLLIFFFSSFKIIQRRHWFSITKPYDFMYHIPVPFKGWFMLDTDKWCHLRVENFALRTSKNFCQSDGDIQVCLKVHIP